MNSLPMKDINITDDFWCNIIKITDDAVLPYQFNALSDKIKDAPKSHSIENFKKAAEVIKMRKAGKKVPSFPTDKWEYNENNSDDQAFKGWVFQDSDLYKWIEAASYSLNHKYDENLDNQIDDMICLIENAAEDDGYIDTLYSINNINNRFENLKDFHELYCFGHMLQAAVAHYTVTGKDTFLTLAVKYANMVCDTFGKEDGKIHGYPGHEIAEMALCGLYDITNDERYLNTAEYFVLSRGTSPNYFDIERNAKTNGEGYKYNQAHCPVMEQKEAVGHAVRGVYLYSGMADVAKRTNNDRLFNVCKNIFNDIVQKKMYITGSIGSTADGEAFTAPYDLRNDFAYGETCASIGLSFFAKRMLERDLNGGYGDVMELALYNAILGAMGCDGKSFFYANPLEVMPEVIKNDPKLSHNKIVRQKWFGCACCPPNLARYFESLSDYAFLADDNSLVVNLYVGGEIHTSFGDVSLKSDYINSGKVTIKVHHNKDFKLYLRLPKWCDNITISERCNTKNGFAVMKIKDDKTIEIEFELKIKKVYSSPLVVTNRGKVAVMRGPLVYCMESVDNGRDIRLLELEKNPNFSYDNGFISANGRRIIPSNTLYFNEKNAQYKDTIIKFIPFYKRLNRGISEMTVFINE